MVTTTSTTLAAAPAALVLDAGAGWNRVALDRDAFPLVSHLSAITRGETGLVITGTSCDSRGQSCAPSIWTSADGVGWERQTFVGNGEITAVVSMDGAMIAAGISSAVVDASTAPPTVECVPGVWRSDNGRIWEAVSAVDSPHAAFPSGVSDDRNECNLRITSMTTMSGRLFAVGYSLGTATAVWTSSDGSEWGRLAANDSAWPAPGDGWLDGITAFDATLVATGGYCNKAEVGWDKAACYGAAWVSTDTGASWTRVREEGFYGPALAPELGGYIAAIAARDDTLYAAAEVCTTLVDEGSYVWWDGCNPAVWTTPDGLTWSLNDAGSSMTVTDGRPQLRHLVWANERLYALGATPDSRHVWSSTDAVNWTEVPIEDQGLASGETVSVSAMVSVGRDLVLVGTGPNPRAEESQPWVPAVWILRPE
jgi:hypothetical protein